MLAFQFGIANVSGQLDGFAVRFKCQLIFASLAINAPQSSKAFAFICGIFELFGNSERIGDTSHSAFVILKIELRPSSLTQQSACRLVLTVMLSSVMGKF